MGKDRPAQEFPEPRPEEPTPSVVTKEPQQPSPIVPEPASSQESKTESKIKKEEPTSDKIKDEKADIKGPEPKKPASPLPSVPDAPKPKPGEEKKLEEKNKPKEEKKQTNKKSIFIKLPPPKFDCDEGNKKINKKLSLNYPTKQELKKMEKTLKNKLSDKLNVELKQKDDKFSVNFINKTSGQRGSLTYDKGTGKLHIEGESLSAAGEVLKQSWNLMTKGQFEDSTQALKELSAVVTQGDTADVAKDLGVKGVKLQEEKPPGIAEVAKNLESKVEAKASVTPSISPSPGR